MSIDQFRGSISKTGVAHPNKFEARIFLPAAIGNTDRDVSLRVKTIDMPGRNISTTTNDTIYGPTHELAMGLTYADEITATFLLSSNLREKAFFDRWQEWIYNPRTYALNFYKDYVGSLEIYQLDQNNKATYAVRLLEVFPKTIGAISYSQETVSAVQDLSVGFAFKEWVEIVPSSGAAYNPISMPETTPTLTKPSIDPSLSVGANIGNFIDANDRDLQQGGAVAGDFGIGA